MKRAGVILIVVLAGVLLLVFLHGGKLVPLFFSPQEPPEEERGLEAVKTGGENILTTADSLVIPWEIAFLPEGDLLATQRTGELLRIGDGRTAYLVEGVRHTGEGGLLGMALHPGFAENRWVYLYLTAAGEGGGLVNRIERYRLEDDVLSERTVIFSKIPGAQFHNGGRMEFGPDGLLYITTGDAGNPNAAQDVNSLAGKILRIGDDGSVPPGNPFGNAVYSFGHRNPQGLVFDDKGRLWSTEHGRSGAATGFDELNLIEKGKNYGWPVIQGDERREGMETPELHSGPDFTWAPGDVEYIPGSGFGEEEGSLFFGGLRGEALYEVPVTKVGLGDLKAHFFQEFGRIRAVRLGPDGMLYLSTSNRDGRGTVRPGDDRIIRVNPLLFQ
ncbi:MAG: PQQ-dependent sugar dehydrogenase [Candidatus Pacearchaeota archaeon]|nr:PQQ-dependent sugar dehydrogenase [Candidatus Pacearchaeota archaeon]